MALEPSKAEVITRDNTGSDGVGWGMARITGEIFARADGSCYWNFKNGTQMEVELPSDPPSPDRFRRLWSPNGVVKDESRIQQYQEDHRLQLALCEKYREKLNQMMDRARREKRLAEASFFHRIRFGIVRFFRRIGFHTA